MPKKPKTVSSADDLQPIKPHNYFFYRESKPYLLNRVGT